LPNKVVFLQKGMVFGRHFVSFAIFSCQRGINAQKRCILAISLDVILPEENKFVNFVKFIKMARVQRVKPYLETMPSQSILSVVIYSTLCFSFQGTI
jgi:hypothetical protein